MKYVFCCRVVIVWRPCWHDVALYIYMMLHEVCFLLSCCDRLATLLHDVALYIYMMLHEVCFLLSCCDRLATLLHDVALYIYMMLHEVCFFVVVL